MEQRIHPVFHTITDELTIYADGLYPIPGLVDIHFHGAVGNDFSDGTIEAIEKIAEYEASNGITAICPATMTLPVNQLLKVMHAAKDYSHSNMPSTTVKERAALLGINLEGPFINPKRAGAQDPVNIRPADWNLIQTLQEESGGPYDPSFQCHAGTESPGAGTNRCRSGGGSICRNHCRFH